MSTRKVLFILGQLSDLDVEWLATNGVRRRLPAGAVLIAEGQPISSVYILLDGELAVTNRAGTIDVRFASGEIAGEMSFVDASPPSASVTAARPSAVLEIPRERLDAKLQKDDGFAARFYRAVAIFLSDRLRTFTAGLSPGASSEGGLEDDELDPNVLDTVSLAGERFTALLRRLGQARAAD